MQQKVFRNRAKFLKLTFHVFFILFVIMVIAKIGIVHFLNLNQFKDALERTVLSKTGLILKVQGPIQWQWSPMPSVELNDIAVQNLAPFSGQLLSAKSIQVECRLLSILMGKFALAVNVKGLKLALIKNSKGQINWKNLNKKYVESIFSAQYTSPSFSLPISLNSLKIQGGNISFNDLSKNNEFTFNHVNFSADNLFKGSPGVNTPLFLSFELTSKNKTLAAIFLNADWALMKEKNNLNFQKVVLTFQFPNGIANVITGNAEIIGFSQPLVIKGNLVGSALQFDQIKIDKINIALAAEKNIINFSPIEIQTARTQQYTTIKFDLRGNAPKIYLTQEARSLEINDLLAIFGKQEKIFGKTHFSVNLSARGTDFQSLKNSLSGKVDIGINNGKFYGIDLISLFKNVQSTTHALADQLCLNLKINSSSVINTELEKWKIDFNSSAFTPFDSLKAIINIKNGMINNPSLVINHTEYAINGAGTINLAANTIQYKAALKLKNNPSSDIDKIRNFLFQNPLFIQIDGRLDDIKIQPNLAKYMNQAFRCAINEVLLDKENDDPAIQYKLHKAFDNILNASE